MENISKAVASSKKPTGPELDKMIENVIATTFKVDEIVAEAGSTRRELAVALNKIWTFEWFDITQPSTDTTDEGKTVRLKQKKRTRVWMRARKRVAKKSIPTGPRSGMTSKNMAVLTGIHRLKQIRTMAQVITLTRNALWIKAPHNGAQSNAMKKPQRLTLSIRTDYEI